MLGGLRDGVTVKEAAASFSVLTSTAVYKQCRQELAWSFDHCERWMVTMLTDLLLAPEVMCSGDSPETARDCLFRATDYQRGVRLWDEPSGAAPFRTTGDGNPSQAATEKPSPSPH